MRCGSLMLGSGTDTYDPTCDLPKGHSGPCKSTAAVDQHRLVPWGHQIKASLYFEGEPTDGAVQDFIEVLNAHCPSAHFIGVAIETVLDEPQDQGAA